MSDGQQTMDLLCLTLMVVLTSIESYETYKIFMIHQAPLSRVIFDGIN